MSRLASILSQKRILLPALTVIARAVVHLLGYHPRNSDVEAVVDALFVVVGVSVGVLGNAVDGQAKKITTNSATINTNAAQLNGVTPDGVVAATVPNVPPAPVPVQKETPPNGGV